MLEYDFRAENEYEYSLNSISDIIPHTEYLELFLRNLLLESLTN